MFCHLGHFCLFVCLGASVTLRGGALGVHQGGVMLYMGEGPRGNNGTRAPLQWTPIFHSATHNQTGPLWGWFLSEWACAHSRPLWVSPTTSPVRLGVSPAAAPIPRGAFNQRFEALFPRAGALGCRVCSLPAVRQVYLCANVVPRGATRHSACPTLRPPL